MRMVSFEKPGSTVLAVLAAVRKIRLTTPGPLSEAAIRWPSPSEGSSGTPSVRSQ